MFKLLKLYQFFVPNLTVISFGGGSSSSSPTLTQEQKDLLQLQTQQLKDVFMPAYTSTVQGAKDALYGTAANALPAMQNAMASAERGRQVGQAVGEGGMYAGSRGQGNLASYQTGVGQDLLGTGATGLQQAGWNQANRGELLSKIGGDQLQNLFSPQYKEEQIQASLQPAREAIREQLAGQNAMYGAAGGLGSSRMALADKNLQQLGQQRLQSAAAQTSAAVEAQRQQAANTLLGTGQGALAQSQGAFGTLFGGGQGALQQAGGLYGNLGQQGLSSLGLANQLAASQIGLAQTPIDTYSKYASIIFGTPQASTNPNFAGTQGSTSSGSGFNLGFGQGSDISIKENIHKIGTLGNGINLYKFEYKDQYKDTWGHGQQIGVMAQEVEKVIPEAVSTHKDGYKLVNYSMVM